MTDFKKIQGGIPLGGVPIIGQDSRPQQQTQQPALLMTAETARVMLCNHADMSYGSSLFLLTLYSGSPDPAGSGRPVLTVLTRVVMDLEMVRQLNVMLAANIQAYEKIKAEEQKKE